MNYDMFYLKDNSELREENGEKNFFVAESYLDELSTNQKFEMVTHFEKSAIKKDTYYNLGMVKVYYFKGMKIKIKSSYDGCGDVLKSKEFARGIIEIRITETKIECINIVRIYNTIKLNTDKAIFFKEITIDEAKEIIELRNVAVEDTFSDRTREALNEILETEIIEDNNMFEKGLENPATLCVKPSPMGYQFYLLHIS